MSIVILAICTWYTISRDAKGYSVKKKKMSIFYLALQVITPRELHRCTHLLSGSLQRYSPTYTNTYEFAYMYIILFKTPWMVACYKGTVSAPELSYNFDFVLGQAILLYSCIIRMCYLTFPVWGGFWPRNSNAILGCLVEQRGSRRTRGRRAGRKLIRKSKNPAVRVAWHSGVTHSSRLLKVIVLGVLGTPLPAPLPGGLIPWRVCQEWKKWENQESSRHISSPGSDHVTQRPHKGFPSLVDLWSKATSQKLGTVRKFSLSDSHPTSRLSLWGCLMSCYPFRPFLLDPGFHWGDSLCTHSPMYGVNSIPGLEL